MPGLSEPPAHPIVSALRREWVDNGGEHFVDVHLRSGVDGQRVPATRVLLSLVSSFFRDIFDNKDLKEATRGEVEIAQFDGPTVSSFVEFCYTGDTALFRRLVWEEAAAAVQDEGQEAATGGGERCSIDTASAVVKLALAGDFFDVLDLTERACDLAKQMLQRNAQLAFPMIEVMHGRSEDNEALRSLVSDVTATIGRDLEATLLADGNMQGLSFGALKDVLNDPLVRSSKHQEAIFLGLVLWAAGDDGGCAAAARNTTAVGAAEQRSPGPSTRRAKAAEIAETCLSLERMPPSFIEAEVVPSGLVSEGVLCATFFKQALAAEQRHLVNFTDTPVNASWEWRIQGLLERRASEQSRPFPKQNRLPCARKTPCTIETATFGCPSSSHSHLSPEGFTIQAEFGWGSPKQAECGWGTSCTQDVEWLGLVLVPPNEALSKASIDSVAIHVVHENGQVTKTYRRGAPLFGSHEFLKFEDIQAPGAGFLVDDTLTVKVDVCMST